MLGDWVEGTGWLEQFLVDQGIIRNKTIGGGNVTGCISG
jgi:hypothetical protein